MNIATPLLVGGQSCDRLYITSIIFTRVSIGYWTPRSPAEVCTEAGVVVSVIKILSIFQRLLQKLACILTQNDDREYLKRINSAIMITKLAWTANTWQLTVSCSSILFIISVFLSVASLITSLGKERKIGMSCSLVADLLLIMNLVSWV